MGNESDHNFKLILPKISKHGDCLIDLNLDIGGYQVNFSFHTFVFNSWPLVSEINILFRYPKTQT